MLLRHAHAVARYATPLGVDEDLPMPELYIAGKWTDARDGGRREIRCPADGSLVAEIDEASGAAAQAAVEAARDAFDDGDGSGSSTLERGRLLHRVADLLERDKAD